MEHCIQSPTKAVDIKHGSLYAVLSTKYMPARSLVIPGVCPSDAPAQSGGMGVGLFFVLLLKSLLFLVFSIIDC